MTKPTTKKVWLVIEKNVFGESQSFSVAKFHTSVEEAMTYKVYLEKLNERKNQFYFLASDIDTVLDRVVHHHNKSVENGHDKPEVKPEVKPSEQEELPF